MSWGYRIGHAEQVTLYDGGEVRAAVMAILITLGEAADDARQQALKMWNSVNAGQRENVFADAEGRSSAKPVGQQPGPAVRQVVRRLHQRRQSLRPVYEPPGRVLMGEKVTCSGCGEEVEVTPVANNMRSSGRQYVARLARH